MDEFKLLLPSHELVPDMDPDTWKREELDELTWETEWIRVTRGNTAAADDGAKLGV